MSNISSREPAALPAKRTPTCLCAHRKSRRIAALTHKRPISASIGAGDPAARSRRGWEARQNRWREKSNFVSRFSAEWGAGLELKISSLRKTKNYSESSPLPQEGRFAIVRSVGSGMRWTRSCRQTCDMPRTAKPCGPGTPGLALSFARRFADDGDYKVMDTGESTEQPLTPSRRECRCFGGTCSD
jgi:hypothetical protein